MRIGKGLLKDANWVSRAHRQIARDAELSAYRFPLFWTGGLFLVGVSSVEPKWLEKVCKQHHSHHQEYLHASSVPSYLSSDPSESLMCADGSIIY